MAIDRVFRILGGCLLPAVSLAAGLSAATGTPPAPRLEFRVVFATNQQLANQLDEAGRDGYSCLLVARNENAAGAPGVVVWLAREAGGTPQPSTYRVVTRTADLQASLDRAGADGFRLCGVVLAEAPPAPMVVAVMSRPTAGAAGPWRYRTEVLLNYKESLARLNAARSDGFVPVAAEAINNNRVPALRNWMVITERTEAGGVTAGEIVVHSDPGAGGLQKKLNDRGRDGYRVDLLWKEGNDFVAMLSRPVIGTPAPHSYAVSANSLTTLHSLSKLYLADFPYLQDRLIVTDASVSASAEVVDDPLPPLGAYPDRAALSALASHVARNQGFVPAAARVTRGATGPWRLTTVIVRRD